MPKRSSAKTDILNKAQAALESAKKEAAQLIADAKRVPPAFAMPHRRTHSRLRTPPLTRQRS